jgi:hypothetical protein
MRRTGVKQDLISVPSPGLAGRGQGVRLTQPLQAMLWSRQTPSRAAPDAQARRRIAIMREIVTGAFLLHQRHQLLCKLGLRVCLKRGDRRIDDLQANRGVGPDRWILGQEIDPGRPCFPVGEHLGVGVGARDQGFEAADRLRPVQRIEIILDAQHRRRVDGLALEDAFVELPALGHTENLRQRPCRLVALEPRHRAR